MDKLHLVAQIGKSYGLKGFVRVHNFSDFAQQFKNGASFFDENGDILRIKTFDKANFAALFEGFESVELAKTLTNKKLYQSEENTRKYCKLRAGEYFYFDILGLKVCEDGEILGTISDILETSTAHLLLIKSDEKLVKMGFAKEFYLPYADFYVLQICLQKGEILTQNAKILLESLS